jgi:hypothetical protein
MFLLYYILFAVTSSYLLYVWYAAVMNVKRVRDLGKLEQVGKVFGYPTLFIGLFLDFIVNTFVMTVLMYEIPKEFTVTSRLKRHNQTSTGWRLKVVKFFEPMLDPLDPSGDHV